MALLAFLMENKNVFGPHLIIVPNAVIVNWKSELSQWLPDVRCVYYVGTKDERARKYAADVQSLQFNILVTTYEYIMRDRAKLSKVFHSSHSPSSASFLQAAFFFVHTQLSRSTYGYIAKLCKRGLEASSRLSLRCKRARPHHTCNSLKVC